MIDSKIEELVEGIKKGVERGNNLEKVAQSFVNAGYKPHDISYAMKIIKGEIPLEKPSAVKKELDIKSSENGVNSKEQILNDKSKETSVSFFRKLFGGKKKKEKEPLKKISSSHENNHKNVSIKRKNNRRILIVILIVLMVLLIFGAIVFGVIWSGILE